MAKADQTDIKLRIIIEQPVVGVLHSLQAKDDQPLAPKASRAGEPLLFDLPIRVAPGPKFFGDQVRRFIYIRIGQSAGDPSSPWSRRMKIDIHDLDAALLARAIETRGVIEIVVNGTGKDGTPACATVPAIRRRLAEG
ncbi:DUF5990 family protein [Sphingobium sp.]|uniref:DUF5990 family protein n=1 Tax=Sphingobium sp. TaxID=1912891 RepID=UPI002BB8C9AB|nr:DUF5990 family protein [Sphingobium sp.]HUD92498.1 DUF5990 family protein [Sphingobium sp.]